MREDVERAFDYEGINNRVSEDVLPSQMNKSVSTFGDMEMSIMEDQQDLLDTEELAYEGEEKEEPALESEEIEKSSDPVALSRNRVCFPSDSETPFSTGRPEG